MRSFIIGFLFLQFFCACKDRGGNADAAPASENDVDAARNFINSVLKQDFDKARTFLVDDSVNYQNLDITERVFKERLTQQDKEGYGAASINIHEVRPVNDSTTVVYYSNSFKKKRDSLKVVQRNGQWLVDLKYSFPALPTVEPANGKNDTGRVK